MFKKLYKRLVDSIINEIKNDDYFKNEYQHLIEKKTSQLTVDVIKKSFNKEHMLEQSEIWSDWELNKIKKTLDYSAKESFKTEKELLEHHIKYINSEIFIDEIVKRINGKQLNGTIKN